MSELNVEIKTEIFKKVEELNLETFVLICKIDRYKDKMTATLYKYMTEQLENIYKNEFENTTGDFLIKRKEEKYERDAREAVFTPQKSKFFCKRNRAAKLIDRKVIQEAEAFFTKCEELLSKLDEAAPQVNNQSEEPVAETAVKDRSEVAASGNVVKTPPDDAKKNALPKTQKPRKQGSSGEDRAADEKPTSRKTGKSKKKEKIE